MSESKTYRTAYIGDAESTKDITNRRKVNLHILEGAPLVAIHDDIIGHTTIKQSVMSTPTTDDNTNILVDGRVDEVDADGNSVFDIDRYKLLTKIKSAITADIMCLYYDALFKDIIIVPETNYLGTSAADDINTNQVFDLVCYVITGGDLFKNEIYTGSINAETNINIALPEANKIDSTTHNLCVLYGISPTMGHRSLFFSLDSNNASMIDKRLLPAGIVDIGDVATLFGDNINLPTYTMYQANTNMYKLKYLGIKKPSKVYLLLDF